MTPTIRFVPLLVVPLLLTACPKTDPTKPPVPPPLDPTGTEFCAEMCKRIGPAGLKCEEGEDVYNSDLEGEEGVPNQSCTDWCEEQQERGFYINPKCVRLVESCKEIEDARQKDEAECP